MPSGIDYTAVLADESRRFRQCFQGLDPGARVPSCPGWTAADLLWHLGEVQSFWARVVDGRLQAPDDIAEPVRPDTFGELLGFFEEANGHLQAALAASADAEPMWTWSNDRSAGFIRRRQAHEVLIHRVDAELAAGRDVARVHPALADDGVDEMLTVMLAELPDWARFDSEGPSLRLETTDTGGQWTLRFGRFRGSSPDTGTAYDEPTVALGIDEDQPDGRISAEAWLLDRWLWGRSLGEPTPEISGDQSLPTRLRELIVEGTQ
jgi:uncharacterized protein (TIGR03083 family)